MPTSVTVIRGEAWTGRPVLSGRFWAGRCVGGRFVGGSGAPLTGQPSLFGRALRRSFQCFLRVTESYPRYEYGVCCKLSSTSERPYRGKLKPRKPCVL